MTGQIFKISEENERVEIDGKKIPDGQTQSDQLPADHYEASDLEASWFL